MKSIRMHLVQSNPVVGDIDGNVAIAMAHWSEARAADADLVVFSELFVVGYPPEDLVLKPVLLRRAMDAVRRLAASCSNGPGMIIGCPWEVEGRVFNAALLLDKGCVKAVSLKRQLPNYGVFDEMRVFCPGPVPSPVDFRGVRIGLPVCEDIWKPDVCRELCRQGAEILVSINGSPFDVNKQGRRLETARARVAETGLPMVYVNQFGGQDELVFDGASFVIGSDGVVRSGLRSWGADSETVDFIRLDDGWSCEPGRVERRPDRFESIYMAMVTGLRDYVVKNRFPGVLIGLSGGVDSALTAAVAVDALGPDKVHLVMMPYTFTSSVSLQEAAATSELLGARYDVVPIGPAVDAFKGMLSGLFAGRGPDITEENIQARVRGIVLMAISNKFGKMVLTTGNKSESSVGYATIYGDMCGGYSVLKDIYKTDVFALSRWRNDNFLDDFRGPKGRVMPDRTIDRPPSAELRADQKDQDSLPPYDELDAILDSLVEGEKSLLDICGEGHQAETVRRVENLLYQSEYKRRQAAPGVKISSRNFGRDRRYPVTNRFRDMDK